MTIWLASLYLSWSGAWLLFDALGPWSSTASFAYWTGGKLVLWAGLAVVLLRVRLHTVREDLALRAPSSTGAVVTLLAGAIWVAADTLAVSGGLKPAAGPIAPGFALVNIVLVAPILEELLFRGVLWTRLVQAGHGRLALCAITATAFTALHLPGWIVMRGLGPELIIATLHVFLAGLLFGLGRAATASIAGAIFLHLLNNLASIGVFTGG